MRVTERLIKKPSNVIFVYYKECSLAVNVMSKKERELEANLHGNTHESKRLFYLALLSIGIVYGDIGTSPLYAIRECFSGPHSIVANNTNIYGVLSLVFWALILVVSVKYLLIILRADHYGEGGILALMELVMPKRKGYKLLLISVLGIFGASLLYGDGLITPAISVLSAVEGLSVTTSLFDPYILPITITILLVLFIFQQKGTSLIGSIFGPVMVLWFSTIALLGLVQIFKRPDILVALNPSYAVEFFKVNGIHGFILLGVVVLVVTGGEALYADIGHFGKAPIRLGWFAFVLPCLLLNYFGQGALLLEHPDMASNPFYLLAPSWALYPLVALASLATIIASQAIISGAFSLTFQAIQLGYLPRMVVKHTSSKEHGQIYIPLINSILMIGTIIVVLGFQNSSNLASAYGLAVTMTMTITSMLAFIAMNRIWKWGLAISIPVTIIFLTIDLSFLGSNLAKILSGGWFPLVVAIAGLILMNTWKKGRRFLAAQLSKISPHINSVIIEFEKGEFKSVPGTAVYMVRNAERTPPALTQNMKHNKVFHQQIILLSIDVMRVPRIDPEKRFNFDKLFEGFYRLIAHYGYMEKIDVTELFESLKKENYLTLENSDITYILGRETLIPDASYGLSLWQDKLFSFMSRNAQRATTFYHVPNEQVFEIGTQVNI